MGILELLAEGPAVLPELMTPAPTQILLLPDFLPLDPMLQVESPQAGHCYSLVSEFSMKVHGSLLEGEACPLLESLVTCQELNVYIFKLESFSV